MTFTPSPKTKAIDAAERAHEREMAMAVAARKDWFKAIEFCLRPQDSRAGSVLSLRDDFGRILEGYAKLREAMKGSKRLVVIASPKLGKSTFMTYGDSLIDLGNDPANTRILIGSATKPNAEKHLVYVRTQIESNPRVRLVWPELAPGPLWQQDQFRVAGSGQAQPSMQAIGDMAHFQGFRASKHKFDDMVDPTIALSAYLCEQQAEWIMDIEDRVDSDGDRQMIQNAHRRHDTGHVLVRKYGWDLYVMPAIDEGGKTLYPKIWPQKTCDEYAPARRNQHLKAVPPADGDVVFEEPWIETCRRAAIIDGGGLTMVHSLDSSTLPSGVFVVHGCDPAGDGTTTRTESDEWGVVSALVGPPEYFLETLRFRYDSSRATLLRIIDLNAGRAPDEQRMVLRLLWVDSGRWGPVEGKKKLIDTYRRYGGVIVAENNGVGQWLRSLLIAECPGIQIHAQATGRNKTHESFGVKAEADSVSEGLYIIPSQERPGGGFVSEAPIERLVDGMREFHPTKHTPDLVSAMWLARCGARLFAPFTHRFVSVDLSGPANRATPQATNPLGALWSQLEAQAEAAGTTLRPPGDNQHQTEQQPTGTGAPTVKRRFFL